MGPDSEGPPAREPLNPDGPISAQHADAVEVEVVPDRGKWAVELIVLFADEVVRKRIATYRTERLARISADLMKRSAEREIGGGPLNG
ncbi:hypothetical protein GCM10009547_16260 [Sporichthya brevicatena]|uniref:Uncharacterized protein n=1 Tax=Sporichthya brevicatena TaxID=171442 RepID=A0ABN1GND6_9ACTN